MLAELTEPESLAMVREALGVEDLPAEVGEAIFAKTKGNPLFLEEVIHSLQAPGVLDRILTASSVTRAAELAALEIPDRVQGLLMSRIDRLAPDTREVLKAGSVVGRSFDRQLLASAIDDDLLRGDPLDRAFDELIEPALVVPDEESAASRSPSATPSSRTWPTRACRSRAAATSTAGSRATSSRRRSPLPTTVCSSTTTDMPATPAKTRFHAVRASESSVAVYANPEAIDYLAIALDTVRGRTPRDACLRSRFEELMGDSLETLARHDEAIVCFARARRRWASPSVRLVAEDTLCEVAPIDDADERDASLCWKIAVSAERGRSAYKRALRWLDKAAAASPRGGRGTTARVLITRGLVLSRLGRYREAVEAGRKGVDLAREVGDIALQAYALNILGTVLSTQGLLKQAVDCSTEAIALYEQVGDLYGQAMGHGNIGADYVVAGDLRSALAHHEESLAFHSRLGNVTGIAFQHMNIGGALFQMGELHDAIRHLEEAIRLSSHQGASRLGTGFSHLMLARSWLWSGDCEHAERELAEAVMILESIDAQSFLLDAGIVASELSLVQGDTEQAETLCRNVVAKARCMSAELSESEASSMLGRILLERGCPDAAIAVLESGMALAEKGGSDYERAKALALLAQAERSCGAGEASCEAKLDEAIHMFEAMGARYDLDKALELRDRFETGA